MSFLELKNIEKNYYQNSEKISVLKNLNLSIEALESVAIVGESGSGKSTLLSLLSGLDQPDSGEIIFDSKKLHLFSAKEWTKFRGENIGVVFQQFHLISHLSALENVMLPLEILKIPSPKKKAMHILEHVGLSHRLSHMPSQLSGGECQRVALARAFVGGPQLLLADEPSGNLDVHTGSKIIDLMFTLIKEHKITALIVTHSMELAGRCGKKYILKNGLLESSH